MLREGMFIAERYEILEKIGSGGMSDVYKAKCHKLNRFVAIKVLKPEFSEDKTFVSKFRAEAQSAAGLMHSNIVNVYDVGEEDGIYYIVMELVEGITLKKYIEKKGKLGIREAVSIAIQIAQGMEAAHKHHIVHRDIKPQNIIISKEGKVKVTDFGIARAASSNTINSTVMGSVHYISPEQARGGYSDEKSDIYSFGITLFEMLTGRVPFEGDTTVAVALQHIQDDMVSPRQFLPEIPVSVEKIVLKCTQKKTERRYQTATDLIADLKRSLVTPNEDFVIISSAIAANAPTQMIDADDMKEITQKAAQKSVGPEVIAPTHTDAAEEDIVYGDYLDTPEENEDLEAEDLENDTDVDASKKVDKVITILGIAVGVVILIITIIVIFKMVNLFKKDGDSSNKATTEETTDDGLVEVPDVRGMSFDAAKEELNKYGLGIKETSAGEYSSYDVDLICKQSADPGSKVDPNTTIIVTLSLGIDSFEMPDVTGKTETDARKALSDKGLVVTSSYEVTEDKTLEGLVKSSDPKAGTTVKSGDDVTIIIYKGPDVNNIKMINVIDKTRADAEKALNDAGFKNVEFDYAYDDSIAEGNVMAQSVNEGTETPDTTTITLTISNRPKPTEPEPETTEPETTQSITGTVNKSIDSSVISDAITDYNPDEGIKVVFVVAYKDSLGNPMTKQVPSIELTNFKEIGQKGPYNVSANFADVTKGEAVINITISYTKTDDEVGKPTGTATTSVTVTIE